MGVTGIIPLVTSDLHLFWGNDGTVLPSYSHKLSIGLTLSMLTANKADGARIRIAAGIREAPNVAVLVAR